MAYRLLTLKSARAEINHIVAYLSEELANPLAAEHFLSEYEMAVTRICSFPESRPLCSDERLARAGYRSFRVGTYLALYRFTGEAVVVVHVFHQSQNYAAYVRPLADDELGRRHRS